MPETEFPTPVQAVLTWITAMVASFLLSGVAHAGLGAARSAGYLGGPTASLLIFAAVTQAALVAAVLIWSNLLRLRVRDVGGFRQARSAAYGIGVLLLVGLFPIAGVFARAVQELLGHEGVLQVIEEATRNASSVDFFIALIVLSVLPGFAEELLFRGYVMSAFIGRSPALAIAVTSLLFAMLHVDPAQVAGTLIIGAGLGALRVASGSVLPCMVAHGGYNALVLLSVRFEVPDGILIVVLALSLALGVWGLAWMWKQRVASTVQ